MNTADDTHPPPTAPDTIPAPPGDPSVTFELSSHVAHNGPVVLTVEDFINDEEGA